MSNKSTFYVSIDDDLELRLYEDRHARMLFKLVDQNRAYLREWLPWLDHERSVEDSKTFISNSLREFAENQEFQLGIWYTGQLVGGIGYHAIDWTIRKVEIGYWLAEAFQGKGLMTKSCRILVAYAFEKLSLNKVEIHCATGNTRSRAIPERLGFKQDGILRDAGWLYDHFIDLVVYSMLAREWQR